MADLPHQGNITVPVQWSGSTQMTSLQAAGYIQTVTHGWRPWTETATLEYRLLTKEQANAMLNAFRAVNFNGMFDYQCSQRGPIRLRLTGEYTFTEEYDDKTVSVTIGVRRV